MIIFWPRYIWSWGSLKNDKRNTKMSYDHPSMQSKSGRLLCESVAFKPGSAELRGLVGQWLSLLPYFVWWLEIHFLYKISNSNIALFTAKLADALKISVLKTKLCWLQGIRHTAVSPGPRLGALSPDPDYRLVSRTRHGCIWPHFMLTFGVTTARYD